MIRLNPRIIVPQIFSELISILLKGGWLILYETAALPFIFLISSSVNDLIIIMWSPDTKMAIII